MILEQKQADENEVIEILYTLIDTYKSAPMQQNTKNMQNLIRAVDKLESVETK